MAQPIVNWTVDYGEGPKPIQVPHSCNQDAPVAWEGPAVYETTVEAIEPGSLVFWGASYQAKVTVDGESALTHRGIWDAFTLHLEPGAHRIRVELIKNGGTSYPVKDVASGFLPFVFHTFAGLFRPVEFVAGGLDLEPPAPEARYKIEGARILYRAKGEAAVHEAKTKALEWLEARAAGRVGPVESKGASEWKPLYLRGILTWGWYPEIGRPEPDEATIRRECKLIQDLGFNLLKFCLWLPPHRYLEVMEEMGIHAWIELPLWDPTPDGERQSAMAEELRRVVRQYRRHPNVALWTAGCELHESTPPGFRQQLVEMIRQEVPGAIVKDNSGGAEMYGGDLREFGDFEDFHPYCDLPFYPEVLSALMNGARTGKPILLGEFNDSDAIRNLDRLREERPYWTSQDPILNDQGVRWEHPLPDILDQCSVEGNRLDSLIRETKGKTDFIRKTVQESVRSQSDIVGYVVTGWRDTPISTSGLVDDWGEPRFSKNDLATWNTDKALFLIPNRRPPWRFGGNRPGWIDPHNWFEGRCHWRIGCHRTTPGEGQLNWDVLHFSWTDGLRPRGRVAHGVETAVPVEACDPKEIGAVSWEAEGCGGYLLRATFATAANSWPIWIVPKFETAKLEGFRKCDPLGFFDDLKIESESGPLTTLRGPEFDVVFLLGEGSVPKPFWRESAYEFAESSLWTALGMKGTWERFLPLSTDRAIDLDLLAGLLPGFDGEVLMNRVDARSFAEHPMLIDGRFHGKRTIVTTLRPFGGLGTCPLGVSRNPVGWWFLSTLLDWASK